MWCLAHSTLAVPLGSATCLAKVLCFPVFPCTPTTLQMLPKVAIFPPQITFLISHAFAGVGEIVVAFTAPALTYVSQR